MGGKGAGGARLQTFLDHPGLYPEHAAYVGRFPWIHAFRRWLHKHRTLVLTIPLAANAAVAARQSPDGWWGGIIRAFFISALVDHFKGFGSALGVMGLCTALSICVYPLSTPSAPRTRPRALAVAPCALAWALVLWGAASLLWGAASGLWAGLLISAQSLKIIAVLTTYPAAADRRRLGFLGFARFLLLVPSLACDPRLLTAEAQLPRRPGRAAAEGAHAALAYTCAHALANGIMAPVFRHLTAAWVPHWGGGEALPVASALASSDWPPLPAWAVAASVYLCAAVLLVPALNALLFYGFWHCVCLGLAEAAGHPDRNLYGPWWLNYDDPMGYFRQWSFPVHRFLSECIHRPVALWVYGRRARRRRLGVGNGGCGGSEASESTSTSAGTSTGGGGCGGGSGVNSNDVVAPGPSALASLAAFLFSSLVHEAVSAAAFRGTVQTPICTANLVMGWFAGLVWDPLFPRRHAPPPQPPPSPPPPPPPPGAVAVGPGGSAGGENGSGSSGNGRRVPTAPGGETANNGRHGKAMDGGGGGGGCCKPGSQGV